MIPNLRIALRGLRRSPSFALAAIVTLASIAAMLIIPVPLLRAQSTTTVPRLNVRLPDEVAGLDAIVRTLVATFDQADIVALGEAHMRKMDSDLRIALVRHPDFAKKVRSVVIECGSVTEQATLDRYVRGERVTRAELERVWKATAETTNGFCDDPIYAEFLAAVRDVNFRLPAAAHIRVLGGHSGPEGRGPDESIAAGVLKNHGKALLIYGEAHFFLNAPADYYASTGGLLGLGRSLDIAFPGRVFTVIPIGDLPRPPALKSDIPPDYTRFDGALKSTLRPVLVSLQRPPFRDLPAENFLGRTLTTCRGGCRSVFQGSALTLGQMADAALYLGRGNVRD
jgi:hypothetical protein